MQSFNSGKRGIIVHMNQHLNVTTPIIRHGFRLEESMCISAILQKFSNSFLVMHKYEKTVF